MSTDNLKVFGRNVKTFREKTGLTLGQVAEFVGVSQSAIAHYELGKNFAPRAKLKRLAEILNTTPEALLGESEGDNSLGELQTVAPWDDSAQRTANVRGAAVFFAEKLIKKEGFRDLDSLVDYLIRARYEVGPRAATK